MKKRLYSINENYFENIDSFDKAYHLGLIVADGNISKMHGNRQPVLRLGLIDKEPLEIFAKYLETDKPIYTIDNSKYLTKHSDRISYLLSITSAKMCSDLMKLGVYPGKTFNEVFPNIPSELNSHFIRGFFDGDGSVFLSNTSRNKEILCASFSGSHQFLIQLIETMNLYDPSSKILYKDSRKDSDCWNIKLYNESRALPLYYYMYKDSNGLYFQRKKSIFDNYINKKVQRLQSAIQEYKILG